MNEVIITLRREISSLQQSLNSWLDVQSEFTKEGTTHKSVNEIIKDYKKKIATYQKAIEIISKLKL